MKGPKSIWLFYLFLTLTALPGLLSSALAQETPIGPRWWPSQWGAEDERGAMNRITPAKVLEATALIREGAIYQLGRPYQPEMPLPFGRHYSLTIPGSPTMGPLGSNQIVWHDEMVSGEIGQIGTQFDGLGHIGVRVDDEDYFYNGFKRSEFSKSRGLEKLGIENVGVLFTRGVLLDVAGYKGVERLSVGYAISPEDIQGTLEKEGVSIHEGDIVLIRTGHGTLWIKDNATYGSGAPGIGLAAARWLIDQKIVMTGSDTGGTEVGPGEDPSQIGRVHQELIPKNGIYNLENLDLEELARDRVYEFAFIFAPLKLKGASGSPGNPIAVR